MAASGEKNDFSMDGNYLGDGSSEDPQQYCFYRAQGLPAVADAFYLNNVKYITKDKLCEELKIT